MFRKICMLLLALVSVTHARAKVVGDVNGDGRVTLADAQLLIRCIQDPAIYYGGVEYVDLGLKSGLLWATCNLGATVPEGYGSHFAWGETMPRENYSWTEYQWGSSSTQLTKYVSANGYGTLDGMSSLLAEDDAAHAVLGGCWHIPSFADWDELESSSYVYAQKLNGINGFEAYSRTNKATLFFPYSGYRSYDSTEASDYIYNEGYDAFYWASAVYPYNSSVGYGYYHGPSYKGWAYRSRCTGYPVRAVIYPYEQVCDINGDGHVSIADACLLIEQLVKQQANS